MHTYITFTHDHKCNGDVRGIGLGLVCVCACVCLLTLTLIKISILNSNSYFQRSKSVNDHRMMFDLALYGVCKQTLSTTSLSLPLTHVSTVLHVDH